MSAIDDAVAEAKLRFREHPHHTADMTPFLLKQLEEGDIPKALLGKIPEGYALVNMAEAFEELNEQFEEVDALEESLRLAKKAAPRLGIGGFIVGAALGGVAGYFVAQRRLETKYTKIAEDEIDDMRQYYRDKERSLDNKQGKPELDSLVREKGYSSEAPMAVTPPDAVVERSETMKDEEDGDPRPPVPVVREENIFRQPQPTEEELGEPEVMDDWDIHKERTRRSAVRPYVVHVDEVRENDDYDSVTYTYYEEDDVLCNEVDEVVAKGMERDALIGETNLNRFGHGSEDPDKVYIRNDRLEMHMEVIRSPNSYAEEVHGLEPTPPDELRHQYRRERRLRDDE